VKSQKRGKTMKRVTEEVVRQFKNHDIDAFNIIFKAYKDEIYYCSLHYVKNKADADDCCQEIFLRLIKNISQYEASKSSFETWFLTLARNYCLTYLRDKQTKNTYVYIDNTSVEQTVVDSRVEMQLVKEDLENLLGEEDCEIYIFRTCYKKSFLDIGKSIGISKEGVRKRYLSAKKKVKNYFNGDKQDEK
jgi:RNA polymerase sigma-70 factor (ECF subfamily)